MPNGIAIFSLLFLGEPSSLSCKESADANHDGTIDISDEIYLLIWLIVGGAEPAAPGPTGAPCGFDIDPLGTPGGFRSPFKRRAAWLHWTRYEPWTRRGSFAESVEQVALSWNGSSTSSTRCWSASVRPRSATPVAGVVRGGASGSPSSSLLLLGDHSVVPVPYREVRRKLLCRIHRGWIRSAPQHRVRRDSRDRSCAAGEGKPLAVEYAQVFSM